MRTVLVVAAERRELDGIVARCRAPARLGWPLDFAAAGELNGQRLLLVANGPGPRLATQAVEVATAAGPVDVVVSAGLCGGLAPPLRCGDVVVASEVCAPETGQNYRAGLPETARPFRSGPVLSLDRVVSGVEEKRKLAAAGALAVEMESAGVAAGAAGNGLPFYCVRAVMDGAGEGLKLDFNSMRGRDGRFSRLRILRAALARPWVIVPELMRLRLASRIAARALGEFFADCRF
ncbi:MAG: hypothetical protein AAB225_25265 [Acidobacteriota bacterium]